LLQRNADPLMTQVLTKLPASPNVAAPSLHEVSRETCSMSAVLVAGQVIR